METRTKEEIVASLNFIRKYSIELLTDFKKSEDSILDKEALAKTMATNNEARILWETVKFEHRKLIHATAKSLPLQEILESAGPTLKPKGKKEK